MVIDAVKPLPQSLGVLYSTVQPVDAAGAGARATFAALAALPAALTPATSSAMDAKLDSTLKRILRFRARMHDLLSGRATARIEVAQGTVRRGTARESALALRTGL